MIGWLGRRWRQRQRSLDLKILWPCVRDQASNLEAARDAFSLHVAVDPAWREIEPGEVGRIVGGLK